jgi:hypothetical protein
MLIEVDPVHPHTGGLFLRRSVLRNSCLWRECRLSLTKAFESRGVSLPAEFSISEICARERPETGFVSAETGSNPQRGPAVARDWDVRSSTFMHLARLAAGWIEGYRP